MNWITIDGGDLHLEGREAAFLKDVLERWMKDRPEGFFRGDEYYAESILQKLAIDPEREEKRGE